MTPPSPSLSTVRDELRQLYSRGEYDALLIRTDNLQKRKRIDSGPTKQLADLLRVLALLKLGRAAEAAPILPTLVSSAPAQLRDTALYAKLYAAWATNENVEEAVSEVSSLQGKDVWRLKAQLLYRAGRYAEAAEMYEPKARVAQAMLKEKRRPATTSRWRIMPREPSTPPVTAAELDRLENDVNELSTNAMAALVLADRPAEASAVKADARESYELAYNMACAHISQRQFMQANTDLQQADNLIRTRLDEDEEDIDDAIAPIAVQKAYLRHLAGDVNSAKEAYEELIYEERGDAASLAVAINNHTVLLGQLAFSSFVSNVSLSGGSLNNSSTASRFLPKQQHTALMEGLKKMRTSSGKAVERKLTVSQRRAIARNRAILHIQMGRFDVCRSELVKLKSEFPGDTFVPIIEASLSARQNNPESADKILQLADDSQHVRAARVQIAISCGDKQRAAQMLQELFPGRPAAVITAASLLEEIGDVETALHLLRELITSCTPSQKTAAKKELAGMLLRVKSYQEAAAVFQEIVEAESQNTIAAAQLVIATSYFDAEKAESVAMKYLPVLDTEDIDVKVLEGLPPPKRKQVAALKNSDNPKEIVMEESDLASRAAAARERKKKKKKKRLPKNYDPNGPPPDPERWLPKTQRSGYKKKKTRTDDNFKGSQGADAAAAEAAAAKNAERSQAKAVAAAAEGPPIPGGRARAQRKKKNRR